jgi:hypothetical protein
MKFQIRRKTTPAYRPPLLICKEGIPARKVPVLSNDRLVARVPSLHQRKEGWPIGRGGFPFGSSNLRFQNFGLWHFLFPHLWQTTCT